jgi:hypothetical protein
MLSVVMLSAILLYDMALKKDRKKINECQPVIYK